MDSTKKKGKPDEDKVEFGIGIITLGLFFPVCYGIYYLVDKYGMINILFLLSFIITLIGVFYLIILYSKN